MPFAQALKHWRQRRFLTQKALAEALGLNLTTVQRWEMGRAIPYPATRKRLIEVLGVTPDEFFAALDQTEAKGKAAA